VSFYVIVQKEKENKKKRPVPITCSPSMAGIKMPTQKSGYSKNTTTTIFD
jgi:hypothetical protein